MKKQTVVFLTITAVLTGVVSFFAYNLYKKPKITETEEGYLEESIDLSSNLDTFPLTVGSKGEQVIALQKFLNATSGAKLETDGIFGPLTLKALIAEQGLNAPNEEKGKVSLNYYNSFVKKYE